MILQQQIITLITVTVYIITVIFVHTLDFLKEVPNCPTNFRLHMKGNSERMLFV